MDKVKCKECNRFTTVVHDRAGGDMVCTECGLVVEAFVIDETAEWRTFANESNGNDPNRVSSVDHLQAGDSLATVMMGIKGDGEMGGKRGWQNSASNPDRDRVSAFHALDEMADRLDLFDNIKDVAKETFAKFQEGSSLRGRTNEAIYAGCIYIACRKMDKPRTFKEIAAVCRSSTKKDIGRAQKTIVKKLEENMRAVGAVKPEEFMRRFCSRLQMSRDLVDAAVQVAKNCENVDLRTSRAPISKASAAIYLVTQLKNQPVPVQEISAATGVAETTIRNTYKDLLTFANHLVPEGFATKDEFDSLPST